MNTFALKEFYKFDKVRFYTVQFTDIEISETDRFINKFKETKEYGECLSDILALIQSIGERGAIELYFNRRENDFQALPNKERAKAVYQGNQLRLYCYRLSEKVVVLYSGGIKDAKTAQESTCSIQFYEAFGFTKKITESIREEYIVIENDLILDYNGNDEIIL